MKEIYSVIEKLKESARPHDAIVGFDGFIDQILHVVKTRSSEKEYTGYSHICQLADKIAGAAGLSTNIELVPQITKIGGNGVIMANALIQGGMNIDYFGALGVPEINPVFSRFAADCRSTTSLCNPGFTDALEFDDGKLMLGKITSLNNINWDNILNKTGYDKLLRITADAELIACTNWTMLFEMNSIITGFSDILSKTKHFPYFFFDLADPAKRLDGDILHVLQLIKNTNSSAKTILGMNEKESRMIAGLLGLPYLDTTARAKAVREKMDIFAVVIHPVKGAAAATSYANIWVDGPYTPKPALTTGAGDNFNAGFCLGLINDLDLNGALLTGVFTSGYYVRNACSPKKKQLIDFMKSYTDSHTDGI